MKGVNCEVKEDLFVLLSHYFLPQLVNSFHSGQITLKSIETVSVTISIRIVFSVIYTNQELKYKLNIINHHC